MFLKHNASCFVLELTLLIFLLQVGDVLSCWSLLCGTVGPWKSPCSSCCLRLVMFSAAGPCFVVVVTVRHWNSPCSSSCFRLVTFWAVGPCFVVVGTLEHWKLHCSSPFFRLVTFWAAGPCCLVWILSDHGTNPAHLSASAVGDVLSCWTLLCGLGYCHTRELTLLIFLLQVGDVLSCWTLPALCLHEHRVKPCRRRSRHLGLPPGTPPATERTSSEPALASFNSE